MNLQVVLMLTVVGAASAAVDAAGVITISGTTAIDFATLLF